MLNSPPQRLLALLYILQVGYSPSLGSQGVFWGRVEAKQAPAEESGQCSKCQTILSVLAVHQPFYISTCYNVIVQPCFNKLLYMHNIIDGCQENALTSLSWMNNIAC